MANKNISVGVKINGDAKGFKSAASDAQKATENLKQSLNTTSTTGSSGFKGLLSSINVLKAGVIAAAAVIVKKALEMGKEMVTMAANAEGVATAFNNLNDPNLLKNLQEATRGTVDNVTLMQKAIQAKNFKIPLEELATYFRFATNRAIQTGESVDYLVESIVNGIGRKSSLVLDNLGISAVELQEELKKTGDFAKAAGNIIKKELGNMGDVADTTATKFARLQTSWENFKVSFGKEIVSSDLFQEILDKLDAAATSLGRDRRPYGGASKEGLDNAFAIKTARVDEIASYDKITPKLKREADLLLSEMEQIEKEIRSIRVNEKQAENDSTQSSIDSTQEKINKALQDRKTLLDEIASKEDELKRSFVDSQLEYISYIEAETEAAKAWDDFIAKRNADLQAQIFDDGYWERQTEAAAEYEDYINKVQYSIEELNSMGLSLSNTFEDIFQSMEDGWESFGDAVSEAIKRLLIKIAALIAAYIILNIVSGGTFAASKGLGNFILGGFGLDTDVSSANLNTSNISGINNQGMNITLNSNLKGRDIVLASNRYNNTLIKNT